MSKLCSLSVQLAVLTGLQYAEITIFMFIYFLFSLIVYIVHWDDSVSMKTLCFNTEIFASFYACM